MHFTFPINAISYKPIKYRRCVCVCVCVSVPESTANFLKAMCKAIQLHYTKVDSTWLSRCMPSSQIPLLWRTFTLILNLYSIWIQIRYLTVTTEKNNYCKKLWYTKEVVCFNNYLMAWFMHYSHNFEKYPYKSFSLLQ